MRAVQGVRRARVWAQGEVRSAGAGAGGSDAPAANVPRAPLHSGRSRGSTRSEPRDEDFYPATIVSYNPRGRAIRGSGAPCKFVIHTDDGMHERVGLPDDGIRIMTRCVDCCTCTGPKGCEHGEGGCTLLPVAWEAQP